MLAAKVICIALIGIAAVSGRTIERQGRVELLPPTLNNSAILDPEGTFRLDWEVIYDQPDNPDLIFELHGATRGWMGIKFGHAENRMLDYFFGAYDSETPGNSLFVDKHCLLTPGHSCEDANGPTEDTRNDYRLKGIEYGNDPNPFTKLRIERRANTGDVNQDLVITPGQMPVGWSWSDGVKDASGLLTPVTKSGYVTITLIPPQ